MFIRCLSCHRNFITAQRWRDSRNYSGKHSRICNSWRIWTLIMVFIWQKLFGKTLKDLKLLKNLDLDNGVHLTETLTQISLHCKNFESLSIRRYTIRKEEASAIVNYLPRIKRLIISVAYMLEQNLVMILKGCEELSCIWMCAKEMVFRLRLASHISPKFKYKVLVM